MAGKYRLTTLGCKVNQYESQRIREVLHALGFRPAQGAEAADVAVINTCAVTAQALSKSRQAVRRLGRGGRTEVYVVGCGAAADAAHFRQIDGVIAALGHDLDVCSALEALVGRRCRHAWAPPSVCTGGDLGVTRLRPAADVNEGWMMADDSADPVRASTPRTRATPSMIKAGAALPVKPSDTLVERIDAFAGHQRAFLKVQDGCDASCTYCIIPQLRPTPRWKPVPAAVNEARSLVAAGHKEIVVTGIFLGAYGRETAVRRRFDAGGSPLAGLVEALARVEGLARLRLSSLEPGDVDETLLEALARHDNCVPHLHLPLQSGSADVLRRMNRQYTVDAFVAMIDRVRAALERPAITTDIIVGFPGETEADFAATVEVARFAEFAKIHAFPFSPRQGTAAHRWRKDFVDAAEVHERMTRLAVVERGCSLAYRRRALGCIERVLVECDRAEDNGATERRVDRVCHGRTDRYFEVCFPAGEAVRPGDLVPVRIDRVTPGRTHGTLVPTALGPPVERSV